MLRSEVECADLRDRLWKSDGAVPLRQFALALHCLWQRAVPTVTLPLIRSCLTCPSFLHCFAFTVMLRLIHSGLTCHGALAASHAIFPRLLCSSLACYESSLQDSSGWYFMCTSASTLHLHGPQSFHTYLLMISPRFANS